ncbi:hypothetical protein H5410_000018 [Solanum commersonii]|uniref:S-adenosylmethionine-dependent methyltransferase At5g38100 n=1 Tax=Solanum commersonii TaxID=4109 RepID=A0A9J6AUQ7_SOLCO|nr:hypothetical protein H5410_000018 [Solanum commersonii]
MKRGDGVYSYTKNSSAQRKFADNAKVMMREAIIENLDVQTKTFLIVDMGCSIGPNTFFAMQNIIEAIKDKYHSKLSLDSTSPEIEFHVFFNDHVTNDFNILFKSLFSDQKPYFASAIPSSFYGRLFPLSSLHIAYSYCAVNWLSQAPKELIDMRNKRRIHYDGASIEVWNAYVTQFHKDMGVFLSARAKEIVPGGLIVLILSASPNMTKVVEKNGYFSIKRMELTNPQFNIDAKSCISHLRASLEGTFNKHFGSKIANEMFERTLGKIEEISAWLEDEYYKTSRQLLIVLKCKINS